MFAFFGGWVLKDNDSRLPFLDLLRAVASQAIVWHHLAFYGPLSDSAHEVATSLIDALYQHARLAVQVFFVVSGYLTATSLSGREPSRVRDFFSVIAGRYRRVGLPYLGALLLAICANEVARLWMTNPSISERPSVFSVFAHALLIHDLVGYEPLSAGIWYLAIDLQLITLVAFVFWLGARVAGAERGPRLGRVVLGVLGVLSLFSFNRHPSLDRVAIYFMGSYGLGLILAGPRGHGPARFLLGVRAARRRSRRSRLSLSTSGRARYRANAHGRPTFRLDFSLAPVARGALVGGHFLQPVSRALSGQLGRERALVEPFAGDALALAARHGDRLCFEHAHGRRLSLRGGASRRADRSHSAASPTHRQAAGTRQVSRFANWRARRQRRLSASQRKRARLDSPSRMKNRRMSRGLGTWDVLGLSLALCGGACGGRAVTIEGGAPGGDGGATASAGAANVGGANISGASGKAGGSSAGSPGAGASSGGAGNNCGQVECPDIACGSGAMLVTEPGACCPTCEPNCDVPCPGVLCASGYQPVLLPGQCCLTCVATPMLDCATGQKNYQQSRAQLTDKYQGPCTSDADCVAVAPGNSCEADCSYVAILTATLGDLTTNLASAALTDCANCGPMPIPACPQPNVSCIQGSCQIGAPD